MSNEERPTVIIYDETSQDGEVQRLQAFVDENGDLVLSGFDLGVKVEKWWGDIDYEYWRTVKKEDVPWVLLELIRERFKDDTEFHEWLKQKGIPSEFGNWV